VIPRSQAVSPATTGEAEQAPQVELAWDTPRAAKALSLSETWLEQMRLKGNGPPFVKIGRRVLYRPEDVSDWLAANLRRSTSDK
jgi:predicted DNA-binding transcriptional regulator AlpA